MLQVCSRHDVLWSLMIILSLAKSKSQVHNYKNLCPSMHVCFIAAFTQQAQPGSGPIFINSVNCMGNEKRLSHCSHAQFNDFHECAHEQDLGVNCVVEIGKVPQL